MAPNDDQNKQMEEFCAAAGEVMMWAAVVDERLTQAIQLLFLLKPSPFLPLVVAEIDSSRKIEMIKSRCISIEEPSWKEALTRWAKQCEAVNRHRNSVAHSHVKYVGGGLVLSSNATTKVLKSLGKEPTSIQILRKWIEHAQGVVARSEEVLDNLRSLYSKYAERLDRLPSPPGYPEIPAAKRS